MSDTPDTQPEISQEAARAMLEALREARAVIQMTSAADHDEALEADIRKVEAQADAAIALAEGRA